MARNDNIVELSIKKICYQCVGEQYLRSEVQQNGRRGKCAYCSSVARTFTIADLAERVEIAFEQHFQITSDQPNSWQQSLLSDRESNYEWERDGEPVVSAIANTAEIPEQAAQDIQFLLSNELGNIEAAKVGEETDFCDGSYYEEKCASDHEWQAEWNSFERSLKTEARFFSRSAATHLDSIFRGIDRMVTNDGRPLVIEAGPNTALSEVYRARAFQSDQRLMEALCRPDRQLGSPPATLAVAGRMNARGISVFYGASDPNVAIAEVRPPVGSQVAVARFQIVRLLRLLDLTALNEIKESGSVFDPSWAARLERATFLRSLSWRITKPVMPDDEAFEYLPTQAIADFLASENEPMLDGIIFPSVQAAGAGLNVVLFHKAARVEEMEIPEGTELYANLGYTTDEGWEADYSVSELVPPQVQPKVTGNEDPSPFFNESDSDTSHTYDFDSREPALRIDLKSVNVHQVRSVDFKSDAHGVRRHRWEKNEYKF